MCKESQFRPKMKILIEKMKQQLSMKNFAFIIVLIGGIIGAIHIILFYTSGDLSFSNNIDPEKSGQFGDYIGGVVGSLWALAAFLLFYEALRTQKEELKLQRNDLKISIEELKKSNEEAQRQTKQFIKQNKHLDNQRFETTFFHLLKSFDDTVFGLVYNIPYNKTVIPNFNGHTTPNEYDTNQIPSYDVKLLRESNNTFDSNEIIYKPVKGNIIFNEMINDFKYYTMRNTYDSLEGLIIEYFANNNEAFDLLEYICNHINQMIIFINKNNISNETKFFYNLINARLNFNICFTISLFLIDRKKLSNQEFEHKALYEYVKNNAIFKVITEVGVNCKIENNFNYDKYVNILGRECFGLEEEDNSNDNIK